MVRHDRQARLVEVGAAGQERIAAATVEIETDGLAAEVATRYLAGAGIGGLRVGDRALARAATSVDPTVRVEVVRGRRPTSEGAGATASDESCFELRDPSAREVARGAREALRVLRAILEVGS
jgi:hypothetical protein